MQSISLCLNVHRVGEIEKILVKNDGLVNRPNYRLPKNPDSLGNLDLDFWPSQLIYAAPIDRNLFARVFIPTKSVKIVDSELKDDKFAWVYWHDLTFASKSELWRFNHGLHQAWKMHLGL